MGIDNDISCEDCKERLCCARNGKLSRSSDALDLLDAFLARHADHHLIFDADDYWLRVPDAKDFQEEEEKRRGCALSVSQPKIDVGAMNTAMLDNWHYTQHAVHPGHGWAGPQRFKIGAIGEIYVCSSCQCLFAPIKEMPSKVPPDSSIVCSRCCANHKERILLTPLQEQNNGKETL